MKPRPSLPQWVVAGLIESTAQSHSGAREQSLRKPNPFKADLSPLSVPPRLIGKYNKENALNQIKWLWIFYGYRGGTALEYISAICPSSKISKQYYNATGYHHISHLLNLNNMTSHNSCISYPPDIPSNISRAKQYEATGHKSQIYWRVTFAWRVISAW